MRLNRKWLKPYQIKEKGTFKEDDGTSYTGYEPIGTTIKANIQPAGGKVMVEMYGERLAYMLTMLIENTDIALEIMKSFNNEQKKYGVCVYVGVDKEPDYKIVAIRPWNSHIVADLEKVT